MRTFKYFPGFLPFKAIGGYKGKIIKYWKEKVIINGIKSRPPLTDFVYLSDCPHYNILIIHLRPPSTSINLWQITMDPSHPNPIPAFTWTVLKVAGGPYHMDHMSNFWLLTSVIATKRRIFWFINRKKLSFRPKNSRSRHYRFFSQRRRFVWSLCLWWS